MNRMYGIGGIALVKKKYVEGGVIFITRVEE